jgi:hypothetical protein
MSEEGGGNKLYYLAEKDKTNNTHVGNRENNQLFVTN